jgi:hypothetical protein
MRVPRTSAQESISKLEQTAGEGHPIAHGATEPPSGSSTFQ